MASARKLVVCGLLIAGAAALQSGKIKDKLMTAEKEGGRHPMMSGSSLAMRREEETLEEQRMLARDRRYTQGLWKQGFSTETRDCQMRFYGPDGSLLKNEVIFNPTLVQVPSSDGLLFEGLARWNMFRKPDGGRYECLQCMYSEDGEIDMGSRASALHDCWRTYFYDLIISAHVVRIRGSLRDCRFNITEDRGEGVDPKLFQYQNQNLFLVNHAARYKAKGAGRMSALTLWAGALDAGVDKEIRMVKGDRNEKDEEAWWTKYIDTEKKNQKYLWRLFRECSKPLDHGESVDGGLEEFTMFAPLLGKIPFVDASRLPLSDPRVNDIDQYSPEVLRDIVDLHGISDVSPPDGHPADIWRLFELLPRQAEKNWVPFEHNGRILISYKAHPHTICEPDSQLFTQPSAGSSSSSSERCSTCTIRHDWTTASSALEVLRARVKERHNTTSRPGIHFNGVQALRIDKKALDFTQNATSSFFLGIVHSTVGLGFRSDDPIIPLPLSDTYYDHYFYVMEPEPPFRITHVSRPIPLLSGHVTGSPWFVSEGSEVAFVSGFQRLRTSVDQPQQPHQPQQLQRHQRGQQQKQHTSTSSSLSSHSSSSDLLVVTYGERDMYSRAITMTLDDALGLFA